MSPTCQPSRRGKIALAVVAAEHDRRVVAAEAERVRDGDLEVGRLAGDVRDVVEVAVGVGLLVVDRRRDDPVAQREDA